MVLTAWFISLVNCNKICVRCSSCAYSGLLCVTDKAACKHTLKQRKPCLSSVLAAPRPRQCESKFLLFVRNGINRKRKIEIRGNHEFFCFLEGYTGVKYNTTFIVYNHSPEKASKSKKLLSPFGCPQLHLLQNRMQVFAFWRKRIFNRHGYGREYMPFKHAFFL